MREPTDREYAAAKRAVARYARKIRELSGNPTVRGFLINANHDDGTASAEFRPSYDYRGVADAARQAGVAQVWASPSLTVLGEIPVTYPQDPQEGQSLPRLSVTGAVACSGGWKRHDLADGDGASPFFLYERPRGPGRFQVHERGAGVRGTARERGRANTLPAALELASSLQPSSVAEILADITPHGDWQVNHLGKLKRLAPPGTRLWVMTSRYGTTGVAATSTGLALSATEALFGGNDLGCWVVGWIDDRGNEGKGLYVVGLEEARAAWWIIDGDGKVVAGGPGIADKSEARAAELAAQFGGHIRYGLGADDPDARSAQSA